jgi:hypothetical protein
MKCNPPKCRSQYSGVLKHFNKLIELSKNNGSSIYSILNQMNAVQIYNIHSNIILPNGFFHQFLTQSSSSLARQPYVGPGLPQKLLPAEVSSCSSNFVTRVFQGGVVSPHAQAPAVMEGRCFLSGFSPLADQSQF